MQQPYQAVKISEHVYWVGAIDWAVRDFHGYSTDRGTTYNAYLIMAEKITLVDTVKAPFQQELLSRIASVVDPAEISYVISNHTELDHSGCLPGVLAEVRPEKVFASVMGAKALPEHFHLEQEIVPVKEGESLSLGNLAVTFLETRMLHWPDSMFTYLPADGVLFSNDAFGMHLASEARFDDQVPVWEWQYEAAKYFANILLLQSPLVTKLLDKVAGMNLDLRLIATDHGPVWRQATRSIMDLYARWARQQRNNEAVVVYDTMYQSTAQMARAIGEGLAAGGAVPHLKPLRATHRSDVMTALLEAGAVLVGSPTLNNNLFPTVADFLTYMKGLRPQNLVGAAFGSYGWSGEAVGQAAEVLQAMKVDLVGEGLKVKYVPDREALGRGYELGRQVAERLKANPVVGR